MKLPSWIRLIYSRKPPPLPPPAPEPSPTACPTCGREMDRIDKSTMSGRDMRTYRCDHCGEEHIVDFGIATWKAMSGNFDA
jgi:DNA-directed RNA polymerase subunit RPC12/RpoP